MPNFALLKWKQPHMMCAHTQRMINPIFTERVINK